MNEEKTSPKKKTDLSKLESQITFQSNVISLTVGELMNSDDVAEKEEEFYELKSKLEEL